MARSAQYHIPRQVQNRGG